MKKTIGLTIVLVIFTLVATVFLSVGIMLKHEATYLKRVCTEYTDAEIIDISRHKNSEGDTYYNPVISFFDGNETKIKTSKVGTGHRDFEIGDTLTVHYNPINSDEYYIEGLTTDIIYIIFFIISFVLYLFPLSLLIIKLRNTLIFIAHKPSKIENNNYAQINGAEYNKIYSPNMKD